MNNYMKCEAEGVFGHFTVMPNDWHEGHWFSGPGWYFADESEQFVGPYDTRVLAAIALYEYCKYLDMGMDAEEEASFAQDSHQDEIEYERMINTFTVHTKCPFCRAKHTIDVPQAGYDDWCAGELIQNALPELSADDRELLITGICNNCFPS